MPLGPKLEQFTRPKLDPQLTRVARVDEALGLGASPKTSKHPDPSRGTEPERLRAWDGVAATAKIQAKGADAVCYQHNMEPRPNGPFSRALVLQATAVHLLLLGFHNP